MLDLPADGEGLSWIVSQDPTQLLLIPGLQPASIAAAAADDQQALAFLRFAAQNHAAFPQACISNPLDKACVEVSKLDDWDDYSAFFLELFKTDVEVARVFAARQSSTRNLLIKAIRNSELAALMWLRAICPRSLPIGCQFMKFAAASGHLHILKYLRAGPDFVRWDEEITRSTAPHLECFRWLVSSDPHGAPCPCPEDILLTIFDLHGLSGLQELRTQQILPEGLWNWQLLRRAAELGDQPMLSWLRAQDPAIPWDARVCVAAAQYGNISMLGWLRRQDPPCPWDEQATAAAAACGNLTTLQWLRAQRPPCPWDATCCHAAADSGHLDILIWLRAQSPPCPWSETCAVAAARQPNAEIMQWLHDHQCPAASLENSICLRTAAHHGNQAVLEWLCDHGLQLTEDLYCMAAMRNQTHILSFLHRMKAPLPDTALPDPDDNTVVELPILLFLADIGVQLNIYQMQHVTRARKSHCTFHGLVRWCRQAVSDPSRGGHSAFNSMAEDRSGQLLLTRLCLLPPELVNRIALAAELQHDILNPS